MAAPPGYHGWGPPPPHLAPAPYPRPAYRPPYGGPPPPGYHYPPGYPPRYPPAEYREPAPAPRAPARSYADEKPAAYQAFQQQAVRMSSAGAEVCLSNGMCQDRHVKDFLLCFQCWLSRTYQDGPWRLQRLDLSRNSLSDESLCSVLESMKAWDLRVARLQLAGNRLRAPGLAKVTEYIWNCRDPLMELDLSDNEVHGEVGESDGISGLLRCLYNHPSYPVMQEHQRAVPLQLGLGGNYIKDAQGLINDILAKGSKDGKASKIRVCSSPEPYTQDHEEFLSIYLAANFLQQRGSAPPGNHGHHGHHGPPDAAAITLRSRSRRRQKRKAAQVAAQVAAPAPAPAPAPAQEAPPEGHGHRRRRKEKTETKEAPAQAVAQAPLLSEEDHKKLQAEVGKKLLKLEGLPSDQSTCDMLSEFTVCMFVARKPPQEVETELASFLGKEYASKLAAWFMKHVRHHYKPAAIQAGWKVS